MSTIATNLQWVSGLADVQHLPEHHCVTITACDDAGSMVTLFFADDDGTHELAVTEAWLRDALDRVQDAKIGAANAQVARIGEPLDLTAVDL